MVHGLPSVRTYKDKSGRETFFGEEYYAELSTNDTLVRHEKRARDPDYGMPEALYREYVDKHSDILEILKKARYQAEKKAKQPLDYTRMVVYMDYDRFMNFNSWYAETRIKEFYIRGKMAVKAADLSDMEILYVQCCVEARVTPAEYSMREKFIGEWWASTNDAVDPFLHAYRPNSGLLRYFRRVTTAARALQKELDDCGAIDATPTPDMLAKYEELDEKLRGLLITKTPEEEGKVEDHISVFNLVKQSGGHDMEEKGVIEEEEGEAAASAPETAPAPASSSWSTAGTMTLTINTRPFPDKGPEYDIVPREPRKAHDAVHQAGKERFGELVRGGVQAVVLSKELTIREKVKTLAGQDNSTVE
ncbi:hypothetical protein NA57DRAFT_54535 [Rhizodiscina lignyota]|uniref:Uncharacterized protein n=1 Tax=Rhizodiscina lignyota TaxID=1504668 RepID=A0A9P4IER8_9PEZI|nr:hypothetical protein NA57DRAFT_54535 [Rhizodiscina lignyota]